MFDGASGLKELWTVDRDAKRVAVVMLVALILGGVLVASGAATWAAAWVGLLWAGACSAVGWFLGFLFGIPRSLSSDTARTTPPGGPDDAQSAVKTASSKADALRLATDKGSTEKNSADEAASSRLEPAGAAADQADADRTAALALKSVVTTAASKLAMSSGASTTVNTNLEQISDWLTKIIVGVTLVESKEVLDHLSSAAKLMAESLGNDKPVSFAFAILIYFSISGLLGSYLLTRLFLQRAFSAVNSSETSDQ